MTINVADFKPLLVPEIYAKISFKSMNGMMHILAGDRVGIRFDKIAREGLVR